ncbi:MAG: HIT domain-containing protein [Acidobacteriota bacterium]|nr:HIT domain-containing protein [Acidobacteriota bacterium]
MDYLWSPWRYRYLTASQKPGDCVFCRIAADTRDEQNLVVHRARHNFVVLNRFPYTSGHLMVVPYTHSDTLSAIDPEAAGEMMLLVRLSERLLRETYKPEGLNLGMNLGESAGAGIAGHIHMHVLPRWYGDANFMTTVGETRVLPEELDLTWRRLQTAFTQAG